MTETKRVGVLTGGGDAPGLNPAIKGLVYRGSELGLEVIGLFDGWRSLMNPAPDVLPLDRETVRRWDRDGGTNLGSSRTNPFKQLNEEGAPEDRSHEVIENIERLKLDAVVAVKTRSASPLPSHNEEFRSSAYPKRSTKISSELTTHSASTPRSETSRKSSSDRARPPDHMAGCKSWKLWVDTPDTLRSGPGSRGRRTSS